MSDAQGGESTMGLPASGKNGEFDINAVAEGLDQQNRTRAAARIASHFSELRGEVERLQERVTKQGQLIQTLEERLKSIEAASKSQSDGVRSDAPEKKSANAQPVRRRGMFPFQR